MVKLYQKDIANCTHAEAQAYRTLMLNVATGPVRRDSDWAELALQYAQQERDMENRRIFIGGLGILSALGVMAACVSLPYAVAPSCIFMAVCLYGLFHSFVGAQGVSNQRTHSLAAFSTSDFVRLSAVSYTEVDLLVEGDPVAQQYVQHALSLRSDLYMAELHALRLRFDEQALQAAVKLGETSRAGMAAGVFTTSVTVGAAHG